MEIADRLLIATAELAHTAEAISEHGVTTGDLPGLAAYLQALTEHGEQIAASALHIAQTADREHPLRYAIDGIDVQADLGHALNLVDAATAFVGQAVRALDRMP